MLMVHLDQITNYLFDFIVLLCYYLILLYTSIIYYITIHLNGGTVEDVKRNNKGQFEKGSKPLGGRPKGSKGIAAYIKEKTNNLKDIVDIAYTIAVKEAKTTGEQQDRRWAVDYITDRAIGKPTQHQVTEATHEIKVGGDKDLIDDM